MKGNLKFLLILGVAILPLTGLIAQVPGNLVPDSSQTQTDTIRGLGVYLVHNPLRKPEVAVDSMVIIRKFAPMVFKGADGNPIKTDKISLFGMVYYVNRKIIDPRDVLFLKSDN